MTVETVAVMMKTKPWPDTTATRSTTTLFLGPCYNVKVSLMLNNVPENATYTDQSMSAKPLLSRTLKTLDKRVLDDSKQFLVLFYLEENSGRNFGPVLKAETWCRAGLGQRQWAEFFKKCPLVNFLTFLLYFCLSPSFFISFSVLF